jgi:single-strand DNA-binding protein
MNEVQVTVIGTVCSEIRYSKTTDDVPAARFQIRCLPRRFDSKLGAWTDGSPSYYSATCWRRLADHVASSMGVGDPVVATGKLRISQWRKGEEKVVSAEIDVQAIGHDLRWGTSAYRRGGSSMRGELVGDRPREGSGLGEQESERVREGGVLGAEEVLDDSVVVG